MKMNFNIGELHPNTPHLFADLAELLLLVGYTGRNLIHKNDLETLVTKGPISHEEIDDETLIDEADLASADRNARRERQLEDVMAQLEFRSRAFGQAYPFRVVKEEVRICEDLTDKQRVYRLLLACSRLRSFSAKGIPQRWAKTFAKVSKVALAGLLPAYASVKIFDANSDDRREYYSTDLREALRVLGRDLRVLSINEDECEKVDSSGDAGLDLVAIVDFDDGAANSYAILGQCGAQEKNWPRKTLEAHPMRYRHFFQMQFDYPGVMFTPVCFRAADGTWSDNQSSNGIFLVDRYRILKLIDMQGRFDEIIKSSWFDSFEHEFDSVDI